MTVLKLNAELQKKKGVANEQWKHVTTPLKSFRMLGKKQGSEKRITV